MTPWSRTRSKPTPSYTRAPSHTRASIFSTAPKASAPWATAHPASNLRQGFSLGYHPGYGYGRGALGVGAEGGYPFYGGPGYPHPWPCLRRIGGIVPFPYYGGPGYPIPGHPNYFGEFGPLSPDRPVVTVATEPGGPD